MITPTRRQGIALPTLICSLITGFFLFSSNNPVNAQPTVYLSQFAGTGVNGYYAGDNNIAITAKFSLVRGVAADASGNILVTDPNNNCIRKIGTDGKVSVVAGIPLTAGSNNPYPSGPALTTAISGAGSHITVAGNGDIYFIANGWTIGKISNGNVSYFIPATLAGGGTSLPLHYTMKARGNSLYLACQGTIYVVDLTTQKQTRQINVAGQTNLRAMALDASGNIFCLGDNGQLSRVDGTTFASTTIKAAGSDYELYVLQSDMIIDNTGNIYIASANNYIMKFTPGTYVKSKLYGENSGKYVSVAVDASGTLFLADQSLCKVPKMQLLDQNYYLRAMTISTGTLSPAFNSNASSFTVSVPNTVDKISITPTVDAATTTMQVKINSGTYAALASGATSTDMDLNVGTNAISILLQAQHPLYSRTITVNVTRQGIPPAEPTNLTTTPGRNNIKIDWTASVGATKYNLYRGTTSGNLTLLTGTPITATTYTDNTAAIGVTYYYAVTALEATNAESPKTTALAGMANTPPVVSAITPTGNPWVGETLTADYTYTDVDGGTNTSTYLWYRYPDPVLNTGRTLITGATSRTYVLATADIGKYVSVRVTPNDGISPGTALEGARVLVSVGTLPVKLLSFKAKAISGAVQLDWKTATEINSHHFEIERSIDARAWEMIGTVNAAGESYMPIDYTYTDKTSVTGRSFYRLKTVDRDGYTEFSSTVQVDLTASASAITVYPIPAINTITVKGGSDSRQQPFTISNAEGKTVRRGLLTKSSQQIDIQELKTGLYFLKVGDQDAVRFMKQ